MYGALQVLKEFLYKLLCSPWKLLFSVDLDTFIVYNERRKVTSSAKKKRRHADKSLHQVQIDELFNIYLFAVWHRALF